MKKLLLVVILCLVVAGSASSAEKLTYTDLIKRLTDLEYLSILPAQGETSAQWSSWDRTSQYDSATGKYLRWDANGDNDGLIRMEDNQKVFAEMTGPGCIWRIWSAAPKEGHVKIYLDGATEPTVDLPFSGYFDLKNAPFVYPSLVHDTASGKNCYIPIPYQKSCKIVADEGWGAYYHFNYTTYPAGTVVPTFKRELSPEETNALKAADDYLSNKLSTDPAGKRKGELTVTKTINIPACGTNTVLKLKGPRAITGIRIKIDPANLGADSKSNILKEVVVRISWDGEKNPSVWTPLIDFFGTSPTLNNYKSLPVGIENGNLYSYWYMPFAKQAVVEFANDSKNAFLLEVSITHAPLTQNIKNMARFHAKWHRDAFLPTDPERKIDWTMLTTQGKGRFCGVGLHIYSPKGGWWGEGDEKFFVDGEKYPSTFGTGSEDYFGYAWGNPALFQNAYHNQPRSDGNFGHISLNRLHITDNIPFQKSFDGYIEKYFPNDRPALYDSISYWYLAPGGVDPYNSVSVDDRRTNYDVPPSYKVADAIEAEGLRILKTTGGKARSQILYGDWSGNVHLFWNETKLGDELVLALPVKDAGKYDLRVHLTKSSDYGIVQMLLDGQKVGDPQDLYDPNVTQAKEFSLGTLDLTSGEHKIAVSIIDKNQKSTGYFFGMDYIRLVPIK